MDDHQPSHNHTDRVKLVESLLKLGVLKLHHRGHDDGPGVDRQLLDQLQATTGGAPPPVSARPHTWPEVPARVKRLSAELLPFFYRRLHLRQRVFLQSVVWVGHSLNICCCRFNGILIPCQILVGDKKGLHTNLNSSFEQLQADPGWIMLLYCLLLSQFLRLDWCDPGHWRFKFCTITCCAEFGVGVDFSRWLLLDSHNMNLWHCLNLERLLGAIHKWRLVLLQTTNVLRVYNVLLMHGGWSEGKTVDIRQKWWRHLWTAPCLGSWHHLGQIKSWANLYNVNSNFSS